MYVNNVKIRMDSSSCNEGFARMATVAFLAPLDPTVDEIADIKTAVSEAVTNCIIHGYEGGEGIIYMNMKVVDNEFEIEITDEGVGIEDVSRAMEPMYTTKEDEERSGMGFCFMEAFMDELNVESEKGKGTKVVMKKYIDCSGIEY